EELGIKPLQAEPLIRVTHHYHDRSVLLEVYRVPKFSGVPQGMEGQPLRWVLPETLRPEQFPAADRPIIHALQLHGHYLITGRDPFQTHRFLAQLNASLRRGLRRVLLRAHELRDAEYRPLLETAWKICRKHDARLLLSRPENPHSWSGMSDGMHLNRHQLMGMSGRPAEAGWVGASCHNPEELKQAETLGLDYVFLSPVEATTSHPDAATLGWERFARWVESVNLPVYALGGMAPDALERARLHGAQGVAGISGFWAE
ncbi:MAG: Nudix family hydrolase, partial [Pseudomonadota bacterium]